MCRCAHAKKRECGSASLAARLKHPIPPEQSCSQTHTHAVVGDDATGECACRFETAYRLQERAEWARSSSAHRSPADEGLERVSEVSTRVWGEQHFLSRVFEGLDCAQRPSWYMEICSPCAARTFGMHARHGRGFGNVSVVVFLKELAHPSPRAERLPDLVKGTQAAKPAVDLGQRTNVACSFKLEYY